MSIRACFLVFSGVIFCALSGTVMGDDPNAIFQHAYGLELKGDATQALTLYNQILTQYPNNPLSSNGGEAMFRAKYTQCKLALKNGDVDAARQTKEYVVKNLNAASQKYGYLYWIGLEFESAGFYDDATSCYQYILAQYPTSPLSRGGDVAFRAKYVQCKLALKNGDLDAARQTVEGIKSFGESAQMPLYLYLTGLEFGYAGFNDYAISLYDQIISKYPQDHYAVLAKFNKAKLAIYTLIDHNDLDSVDYAIAKMVTDFATVAELPGDLGYIAGRCQAKGIAVLPQGPNPNNPFFKKSATILENYVIPMSSNNTSLKSAAYYILGLSYQGLDDYAKAAEAFNNSYETDPNFEHADYCLFVGARCYAKLLSRNAISETESKAAIHTAYSVLVSRFPKSQYSRIAASWLVHD